MIVALHVTVGLAQHNATDAVTGFRKAADEAMCIAIGANATITRHGRAFGIFDALVVSQCRFFTSDGKIDRCARIDRPRVIELQIRHIGTHHPGFGKPGILILGRVLRNCTRFADRFAYCR